MKWIMIVIPKTISLAVLLWINLLQLDLGPEIDNA